MGLDIRWPIGLIFTLIGVLQVGFGVFKADESMSLGINVNLWWGLSLLAFGLLMLAFALRKPKE
jgi:hypothetical protein